jgi:hypothetical protein
MNEKLAIAQNVNTSQETLKKLASEVDEAHSGLIGEDQISKSSWKAIDYYGEILLAIAQNTNTPFDCLKTLRAGILRHAAEHPHTSPQILDKLANLGDNYQNDSYVCTAVAQNISTPQETLVTLTSKINSNLHKLVNDPATLSKGWNRSEIGNYRRILFAIANNPNTPLDALKMLDEEILHKIAEDPNTPLRTIEKLGNLIM